MCIAINFITIMIIINTIILMTRFMNIKVLRFHLLSINGAVPIDIVHSKRPAQFFLCVSYQLSRLLWKIIKLFLAMTEIHVILFQNIIDSNYQYLLK